MNTITIACRSMCAVKESSMVLGWLLFTLIFGLAAGDSYENIQLQNHPVDMNIDAAEFLVDYSRQAAEMCNRVANSEWRYATNTSDFNRRRMREQQSVATKFECLSWKRSNSIDMTRVFDPNIKRQLLRIFHDGKCGLGDDKYAEFQHLLSLIKDTYNNAKVCPYRRSPMVGIDGKLANYMSQQSQYCDLKLDPDLVRIMAMSRDERELRYVWEAWHDKTGPPLRNTFMRYLDLANQAAYGHGFRDAGEQMRSAYEDPDFFFTVQDLWTSVVPLYKQLFTFVRAGLMRKYGIEVIRPDGPIPAHLLGNMWGQNWRPILDVVTTGPIETPDVTGEMVRQGFTPLKIFQVAEEFFTSIGLPPMSPEFWRNSMLQKSTEVYTQCTASAWDFCNNIDFRVKQCTQIGLEDFVNSHREMTHIEYYMQYSNQPFVYREGPNPAYQEAVAHAIGLSVGGPVHLQRIGLLKTSVATNSGNTKINIEYLLGLAMDKLPLMAFSLALEKWRWYVFEKGPIGLNARWWDFRLRYQGIIPPVIRSSEHFDAASKYHAIADQDYIKYFVATVLQFQIFKELCLAAGHQGTLHTCDFYRSREAGRLLSDLMQQGASMNSAQILHTLTRGKSNRVSADALIEFFKPLETWLIDQNRNEIVIGWNSNMEDVKLFQSMASTAYQQKAVKYVVLLSSLNLLKHFF